MKLRPWGTRGNLATPSPETLAFGGNSSAYQVTLDADCSLVLDAGTGIVEYASRLIEAGGTLPTEFHLLVTHFHWDHIIGFPFFHVIHRPGTRVYVYSGFEVQRLEAHFGALFDGTYSPLKNIKNLNAEIHFRSIPREGLDVHGARIRCCPVDHTEPCFALRLDFAGSSLTYVTDHEARRNELNQGVVELARGTSLLLHDAQFTEEEYRTQVGSGHSSMEAAMANARQCGAEQLLLTHHDPQHSDDFLESYLEQSRPDGYPVCFAQEGHTYEF